MREGKTVPKNENQTLYLSPRPADGSLGTLRAVTSLGGAGRQRGPVPRLLEGAPGGT